MSNLRQTDNFILDCRHIIVGCSHFIIFIQDNWKILLYTYKNYIDLFSLIDYFVYVVLIKEESD